MLPHLLSPQKSLSQTASNKEKAPAQNEAAIALRGTMRDFKIEIISVKSNGFSAL